MRLLLSIIATVIVSTVLTPEARADNSYVCPGASMHSIDVKWSGNWGGLYTLVNNCGVPIFVVVDTTDAQNKCERDIVPMGSDPNVSGTQQIYSYFNTKPVIRFQCVWGGFCNITTLRENYGAGC